MVECPKCGFAGSGASECPRCGIVFARWRRAAPVPAIDREGWLSYGGGLAAALVVIAFPLAHFVFSYFTTLVHEMGHAAAGWLFGYPSIPAFDFTYGGGITLQQDRVLLLVVGIAAAAAWGAVALRTHAALRNALAACLALYVLLAATQGHHAVILAMGHGGELLFATLFLHRALSGRGCTIPLERPLYGLVGWFVVLSDVGFVWRLLTSPFHRGLYEEAKGGGHWMDFSRLAEEFLHVRLETVAVVFLVLCMLPPLVSVLIQGSVRDLARAETRDDRPRGAAHAPKG
jgi:hypothetical protein